MKYAIKMDASPTMWLHTKPDGQCVWTEQRRLRSTTTDRKRAVGALRVLRKSGYPYLVLVRCSETAPPARDAKDGR